MLHLYIQLCSTCLTPATWAGPSSKSPSTFSFTTPFSSGTSLRFIPIPVMSYLAILENFQHKRKQHMSRHKKTEM
uniref:Uncharacterized protein n=1 Tax=Rhizophora mucronata TaxID=61149 RepID=A0A2P2LXP9_RHIMU